MAVKLRLQRHGKKGSPFYHIVAADSRSPRDGKFIERIGSYNPNTNPATIQLDNSKAIQWLNNGAQPTDTVRAMLSYTGVLYRQHLQKGVSKGAFTQEEADKRFEAWSADKSNKVQGKKDRLAKEKNDNLSKMLKHEREVNENRLKAMTAAAEAASASAVEAPAAEAPAEEAPAAEEAGDSAEA
jgi:small subunit ribosomal protein S16